MSVRMRHTRGHTNNRRSHHALKGINVITDKDGKLSLPHRVDETTGMYRGKQIFEPKAPRAIVKETKKGPSEKVATPHEHDHATHVHENAEVKEAEALEKPKHSEAKAEKKASKSK